MVNVNSYYKCKILAGPRKSTFYLCKIRFKLILGDF